MSTTNNSTKSPSFIAYIPEKGKDDKTYYKRIGVAFDTKNGGLSLLISAVPLDGRLVLFKADDRKET